MRSFGAPSIAALLAIACCACTSISDDVAARGTVFGRLLETRVDSPLAADYLAGFDAMLASPGRIPPLLPDLPACGSEALRPTALRRISTRYSVDVAALFAAHCLIRANRDLGARFAGLVERLRSGNAAAREEAVGNLSRDLAGWTVLLVPGWDYVESGAETGADFARQRTLMTTLGIENTLVPIDPTGSVEANALVVRGEIVRLSRAHARLVIVSASSGGPAVAAALGSVGAPDELDAVHGWLNLGGILGGAPIIDAWAHGFRRIGLAAFAAINGWRTQDVESMSTSASRERIRNLRLPAHVAVVNYVGIPLTGNVSSRAAFFYRSVRALGPNDGLTLITDPILPGTATIVALGQDHFFADDPDIETKSLALASILTGLASRSRAVAQASPRNAWQSMH